MSPCSALPGTQARQHSLPGSPRPQSCRQLPLQLLRRGQAGSQGCVPCRKSFLEIIWAGVRAPVEPQLADVSVVPYTVRPLGVAGPRPSCPALSVLTSSLQELPKIKDCIVHAKATGVSSTHVQLSTGQEVRGRRCQAQPSRLQPQLLRSPCAAALRLPRPQLWRL